MDFGAAFLKKLLKKNKEISNTPNIIKNDSHKIKNSMIDFNALKVVGRLKKFGFEAYIVGGAVRDCLLGKKPKDYDVATNATPKQIRHVFSNSRIIGKRFKLAHIIFKDMIIETATFRSDITASKSKKPGIIVKDNVFGTMEEDACRRDFGINALYYDPENETIIDYVGGFEDIKEKLVRTLKKPSISFQEDPVRMLRAVKYSTLLNCKIEEKTLKKIKQLSSELSKSSPSRLHEEINKMLKSGNTSELFISLTKTGLLKYLIPFLYEEMISKNKNIIVKRLATMDKIFLDKNAEEYELYWGIILYERLIKENYDENDVTYVSKIRNFFINYLAPLRVPNKTSDHLTRVFHLYFKMLTEQGRKQSRKLKKYHFFNSAKILLEIFGATTETINFWNTIDLTRRKPRIQKTKKQYAYKQRNDAKKVISTRNITN